MMNDLLNLAFQNWLGLCSFLVTLFGVFWEIRSKKKKCPTYQTRIVNLTKENINKIESVDILYDGNKIDNLSVSKIAIWNAGKDTILDTDNKKENKLRIEIDESYKILDCKLIFQREKSNNFILTKINENLWEIDFNFIDYKDGTIIQVYHTATKNNFLKVKGYFIGVGEIKNNNSFKEIINIMDKIDYVFNYMFKKRLLEFFLVFILILLFVISFVGYVNAIKNITMFINVFAIGLYLFCIYMIRKLRVPKSLKSFEDDF